MAQGSTLHNQELVAHDHEVKPTVNLYVGQKNFWRARQNVDLQIVEHTAARVIEVIAYSSDFNMESPRIYIDVKKLHGKLDSAEIDEKVNARREDLARQRKRVPAEELKAVVVSEQVVAFILSRLQIVMFDKEKLETAPDAQHTGGGEEEPPTTTATATATGDEVALSSTRTDSHQPFQPEDHSLFNVVLQAATGDVTYHGKLDMVLNRAPEGIAEIVIPRRKKTSMQDFHKEMRALRADHAQLNHACANAQRKAGLAVQSTDAFKGMLRNRHSLDESHFTVAQKRWMWACHKVILQNYVASVHRRLERYSLSALPSESITKEGQDLKDKLRALSGGGAGARGIRGSQSSLKLPSLAESSKDARKSRSSRDLNRNSFCRAREIEDFSKSLSVNVQSRVEARQHGQVETGRSPSLTTLPSIVSPEKLSSHAQ